MRAVLCKSYGPPETLVVEDVPDLTPGAGQVVIAVHSSAVNFPDTLIIENKYQFKPNLPFSPGGEVAGKILSCGEGVSKLKPGQKVVALTGYGGFAEQVLADENQVFPIPDAIDEQIASAMLMTYGTSLYALKDRARLQKGETLLVLGAAGGVGLAAVELGKYLGAKVIAAASTEKKLEICKEKGADEVILYTKENLKDRAKELTNGEGANVVYDPVGGELSELALRATAWEGRFLVIGFAAGNIPKISLNLTLLKGCDIRGVFWGSFMYRQPKLGQENTLELMKLYQEGKIRPHIDKVYSIEQATDALNALKERRAIGKIVLRISS